MLLLLLTQEANTQMSTDEKKKTNGESFCWKKKTFWLVCWKEKWKLGYHLKSIILDNYWQEVQNINRIAQLLKDGAGGKPM